MGRTASLLLLFRTKATPGSLRNFAPRNDDPARSEAAGGTSQRWRRIKAPSKPFSKLLQNSRVSLQAFPNKTLAILWDCKGLQGFQMSFDAFQIFRLGPSSFGRILPDFTVKFSRRCLHRSSDPDRENFEPTRLSCFWEEISVILPSRHWQVPHRPPTGSPG